MLVSNSSSSAQTLLSLNPGGRICSTPAYRQTSSDQAVQLDSADDWIASQLIPEVDMKISSFARYVTAVGTEGDGTLCVYSNSTAKEPNGDLNGSHNAAHEDQTDSSTPLTVAATSNDGGGLNDEWLAFDGDDATYWKSGADPATTAQELEIDFGVGNEKIINKVIITAANEASADSRCFPKTFTIQGHNGTSYSTLKTVGSSTDPGDQGKRVYTWTNTAELQKVKINITDNHGAGAFVCVGEIEWIEAQEEDAPGALLATLTPAAGSGDTADEWTYFDIASGSQYQLTRDTVYWIVMKGTASKDWSESIRRWNTATGSMFPDSMPQSKYTTDGGTIWSQCQQDSKPALWNVMINPVEAAAGKPVPQLCYGRFSGKYIFIPGAGMCEIPESGIFLDMSDHNSPDSEFGYHVWLNNESGNLTLSATTEAIDDTDGIMHKAGATGYRYLGKVYPEAIHTGHFGPTDCMDSRLVANRFNRIVKFFGKLCPFYSSTYEFVPRHDVWFSWNDNGDDYFVKILLEEPQNITFTGNIQTGTARTGSVGIGVDKKIPQNRGAARLSEANQSDTFSHAQLVCQGLRRVWPLCKSYGGSELIMYYFHALEPSYVPCEYFGIAEF